MKKDELILVGILASAVLLSNKVKPSQTKPVTPPAPPPTQTGGADELETLIKVISGQQALLQDLIASNPDSTSQIAQEITNLKALQSAFESKVNAV